MNELGQNDVKERGVLSNSKKYDVIVYKGPLKLIKILALHVYRTIRLFRKNIIET